MDAIFLCLSYTPDIPIYSFTWYVVHIWSQKRFFNDVMQVSLAKGVLGDDTDDDGGDGVSLAIDDLGL